LDDFRRFGKNFLSNGNMVLFRVPFRVRKIVNGVVDAKFGWNIQVDVCLRKCPEEGLLKRMPFRSDAGNDTSALSTARISGTVVFTDPQMYSGSDWCLTYALMRTSTPAKVSLNRASS
jgi:hypothetical protein